jgi:tetratricopeptide (TPR) repeat protein
MLPVLFFLPETRQKLLLPLTVYTLVSLMFLAVQSLNFGGYNGIHWLNIVSIGSSAKQGIIRVIPAETDILRHHGAYSLPVFVGRILGGSVPAILFQLPLVILLAMSLSPLVLEKPDQRLRAAVVTVSLCVISHFLCCYAVSEYHYATLLPVLPALLWLWQRESAPRLRWLLMAAFIVSLPVFMPTLCFLAPKEPARFQTMNLLQRVVPSLAAFLFLTVYGIAWTWRGRRKSSRVATRMTKQFWPSFWFGAVLAILLGSVLAAACLTAPRRLFSTLSNWTRQDIRRHFEDMVAQARRAVANNPNYAEGHCQLGKALAGLRRPDEAATHFQRAVEIQPDHSEAHYRLALTLVRLRRTDEAIDQFRQALAIKPDDAEAQRNLAWLRATCPKASLRNGAEAIEHAQRANQLSGGKRPDVLGVLAAAYAEAGRFPEARASAREALKLATQQKNGALAEAARAWITLYEAGKPFRQPPAASAPAKP